MSRFKIDSVGTKLFLYVFIASFSSMLTDLGHYTCHDEGFQSITPVRWLTIVLNFIVQGMIAWRAFIDGSDEVVRERQDLIKTENVFKRAIKLKSNSKLKTSQNKPKL
jgi:hypothetical protein